jgi:hypothetical protein
MSSGHSSWLKRWILYKLPRLYSKCPEGNYHLQFGRSAHLCFCRVGYLSGNWHGGIYDMKTGDEYLVYEDGEGEE